MRRAASDAAAAAGCSPTTARSGARFVAGADEAGRGCLAGPLVAAAVLFDYERSALADLRALTALNDSKQHTEEGREELYPRVLRIAAKVAVTSRCVRGIDERGLHETNLAALSDMLRRVGGRGLPLPVATASRCRATGFEQRPVVGGDATARRDRRRLRDRQGHARPLHAADGGALSGLGVRDPRRLLDARAPRGDREARRLAAAPACRSSRWPTSSWRSEGSTTNSAPPSTTSGTRGPGCSPRATGRGGWRTSRRSCDGRRALPPARDARRRLRHRLPDAAPARVRSPGSTRASR